jgi:hypothetical protein
LKIRFVFVSKGANIGIVQSSNPTASRRRCSERITMPSLLNRFQPAFAFWPRRSPARAQRPEARAVAPAVPTTRELELEEIRGAAMRRMFPKLFIWCAERWDRGMAVEVHAYLAGATNVADLEQRIRNVERARHFSS